MKEIFHDQMFWGFMISLATTFRYLLRVGYLYNKRIIERKAQATAAVENLRKDVAIQIAQSLKEVVDKIEPIIERHEATIKDLEKNISNLAVVYANTSDMINELRDQYIAYHQRMDNVSKGSSIVMEKLKAIETEIIELKSGNLLVRTKKSES